MEEKKQIYSQTATEECPTQCQECQIFYSGGSCMIFTKKITRERLCKKCFDKLNKIKQNE